MRSNIYSLGKNKYGELGLNTSKNTFIPSPIKTLKQTIIKSVKSGGRNTIILTSDGQVLMCGSNIFNLLAINTKFQNNEQYQKTFKNIKFFEENNETIKEIAVAEFHSMALTNNGEIYGWGGNLYNKLGQTNGLCGLPSKIYIKRKIVSISCGDYHSCALSENGVLYSWGGGGDSYNKGQCGHGTKKDVEHPKKIEFFTKKGLHVKKVSCGGYHTIVMDENNQLYGFGKGIFGQCGYGKGEDADTPQKIIFNDEVNKIIDIKCGGEHTIFLSNNGRVYACGHGYYGQLGLGNNKNVKSPILVHSLSNKNVLEIAAGWSHTLVLTDENNVYSAGCGKFGELGLGEDTNRYNYTWIRKLGSMNIKHIFAGGHHSWCIIDDKNPLKDKFVEPEPLEKPNYKMPKRKLSEDSNRNNLSFNDTINPNRNKGSNTVDYGKNRRNPYKDDNESFDKNKKSMNNLNVIDNKDLKRMIDDYNDDKNKSLNNIDNIIDYFDNINTPDSMKKKIKYDNINNNDEDDNEEKKINDFDDGNNRPTFTNLDDIKNKNDNNYNSGKDSSPYINDQNNNPSENSFENKINKIADEDNLLNSSRNNNNKNNNLDNDNNNDDDYIRNNINTDSINHNNNFNNRNNDLNNTKGNYNKNRPSDNNYPQNNNNKNFDPYNKYNRYNSNNSRDNNFNKNDSNSNFNDFSNTNQNKKSSKIPYNNSNNNYNNNNNNYNNNYQKIRNDFGNNTLSYLKKINYNRIQLQLIYTELNLSHRFIRFEISNTNKYYKLDYKAMNNMIRKYLSLDKGNISFYLQDDREAVKGGKKPINPMVDKLMKEMVNTGLFNSENKNKISYTIAIVYDYNKNEMLGKLYEEMKENHTSKNISFLNFRIIDENQILNEPNGIEGALSKWTIDFFEQFKELFIVYEDDISGANYGVSNERIIRPRFLEMRPKIFK